MTSELHSHWLNIGLKTMETSMGEDLYEDQMDALLRNMRILQNKNHVILTPIALHMNEVYHVHSIFIKCS